MHPQREYLGFGGPSEPTRNGMAVKQSGNQRTSEPHRPGARRLPSTDGTVGKQHTCSEGNRSPAMHARFARVLARLVCASGLIAVSACAQTSGRAPVWEMFLSGSDSNVQQAETPLSPVEGVPPEAVEACQTTIAAEARVHGATQVEAVSAGTLTRLPNGVVEAPIEARIVYEHDAQTQVRQARVACRLNDQGSVIELL
jgi:hypothetical protein